MPSSVVTCDQKVDVEPPSLRGGEGVELLQEQASLLGLGGKCSTHDKPVQTVWTETLAWDWRPVIETKCTCITCCPGQHNSIGWCTSNIRNTPWYFWMIWSPGYTNVVPFITEWMASRSHRSPRPAPGEKTWLVFWITTLCSLVRRFRWRNILSPISSTHNAPPKTLHSPDCMS
jgi:hypothetical protein